MKKTSDSVPALESSFSIGNGLSLKGWLSISWFLFIGQAFFLISLRPYLWANKNKEERKAQR
jgi:hypothetical protein